MHERHRQLPECTPAVADYPAGARLPMRVIDDYEFVWMLRGRARFITPDDHLWLSPGQLLLIPPHFRHGFDWDRQRPSPGRGPAARRRVPSAPRVGQTFPCAG